MMADCYLTERQKELLRSLVPGLNSGTIKDEWIYFSDRGRIRGIQGLEEAVWQQAWAGEVTLADFDAFTDCQFFRHKNGGRYTLNVQRIVSAVESDFDETMNDLAQRKVDRTQIVSPLFGPPSEDWVYECNIFMIMPFRTHLNEI
jgi:hypothetical protein